MHGRIVAQINLHITHKEPFPPWPLQPQGSHHETSLIHGKQNFGQGLMNIRPLFASLRFSK